MDIFYLALFITTISMTGILTLVFFDIQLKNLLPGRLYSRAFTLMTVVGVAGILWAATLGFSGKHGNIEAMAINNNCSKP